MANIFQDSTKTMPKDDEQIVRVGMKQSEVGGRTDHINSAKGGKSSELSIKHVDNAGSKT